jgi:hypothetical protein
MLEHHFLTLAKFVIYQLLVLQIRTTDRLGADGYNATDYTSSVSGTSFSCPITAAASASCCLQELGVN